MMYGLVVCTGYGDLRFGGKQEVVFWCAGVPYL